MSAARTRPGLRSTVTVRHARLDDLDALVGLEHAIFAEEAATRRSLRHAMRSPTMSLLAAFASGELGAALLGAAIIECRSNARAARLSSIAVAPVHAGRGIGSLLLAAAEERALVVGRERLRLEVRADNRPAIRLYEHHGYARFAVRPNYYEDGMTAWCYERTLGPSRATLG